jgi:hypothetical protein
MYIDDWYGTRCYCGPSCVDKGACCINYEDACVRNISSTRNSTAQYFYDLSGKVESMATCEYMPNGYSTYWSVVTRCRRPMMTTAEEIDLCEGEWRELSQVIPVITANNIYANIHCNAVTAALATILLLIMFTRLCLVLKSTCKRQQKG